MMFFDEDKILIQYMIIIYRYPQIIESVIIFLSVEQLFLVLFFQPSPIIEREKL